MEVMLADADAGDAMVNSGKLRPPPTRSLLSHSAEAGVVGFHCQFLRTG